MKEQMKRKDVEASYENLISVGYCDLQNLLAYREPIGYYATSYGWRADIYEISDKTAIVTGYGPFGNYEAPYSLTHKYEEPAINRSREEREELIERFIKEVIENYVYQK